MKERPNPATDHQAITTARRQDNIRSSALVRGRSIQFMARPSCEPRSRCSEIGFTFSLFSRSNCMPCLHCCVPILPSHSVVFLDRTVLYPFCSIALAQHFNDIHVHTYVYSVTPVKAQDNNSVYTRVYIHTMFSCQGCFRGNRRLAFYQDNGSEWNLIVHGFSDSALMSDRGNVYHLDRAALGVDKWPAHAPSLGQMADLPSRWPKCRSDPKLCQHLKVFEKLIISQVEFIHPSQAE